MEVKVLYNTLCFILVTSQGTILTEAATTAVTTTEILTSLLDKLTTTAKPTKPEVSTLGVGKHYKDVLEEFEASLTEKQRDKYMIYRSEASGTETLHVTASYSDKKYKATLCVKDSGNKKVKIQVIDIIYSNDGPSDYISLQLDGEYLGSAKTEAVYNRGYEWNVFRNTGPVGQAASLENGNHTLTMTVKTDQWGAEFDSITVRVENQDPATELFCKSEFI